MSDRITQIRNALNMHCVDKKTIDEIFSDGSLVNIIKRMEKVLCKHTLYKVMESYACETEADLAEPSSKNDNELAGKTVYEKIVHLINTAPDFEEIICNPDNTLAVTWSFEEHGKYKCVCNAMDNDMKISDLALKSGETGDYTMPLSYCICCAGSCRIYFQSQVGIKLRTKEVTSSPLNSKGEKPCSFVFTVVD